MEQFVHKVFRVSNKTLGAPVCLLVATALDKMHLLYCPLMKDLAPWADKMKEIELWSDRSFLLKTEGMNSLVALENMVVFCKLSPQSIL